MTPVEVFVRHEAELDALFYFDQIREKKTLRLGSDSYLPLTKPSKA